MRLNRLWVKLAAICAGTAAAGVLIAAIILRQTTGTNFSQYLRHVQGMGQMMGGGFGNMMGPNEAQFLGSVNSSLWIAGIIAVIVAGAVAVLFAREITAPIRRLSEAADGVRRGDMSQRVEVKSHDEVGSLSEDFNTMVDSLKDDQDARRKLMSDLAHEMGTPLAVIQSNLEGMLDGVVEATPTNISSLHQEAILLSRLVSDLRTLSQAESGRLNLSLAPVDIGELVESVVTATRPEAARKGIDLSYEGIPSLPRAMMDRDRISQVIANLLSNALRYTSAGGAVRVAVSSEDGKGLAVSVADSGQGISAEDLPHIFDRFYRGAQPKTSRVAGSGIGLAVVKELVEAHKGRVWVESKEGRGSTFHFTVPAA